MDAPLREVADRYRGVPAFKRGYRPATSLASEPLPTAARELHVSDEEEVFVAAVRYRQAPDSRRPSGRPFRRSAAVAALPGAVLLGWVAVWALGRALDVAVTEEVWRQRVVVSALAATAGLGGLLGWVALRRPRLAADAVVALAAVVLAGLGAVALHGTRWGWYGLFADSSFRTQMATRYAEHLALVDYGYRDLPAYYPPAVGWLEGRLAAAAGIPAWQAVQPVQLLLSALIPLLAYGLWRRVTSALPAAAATAATTLLTAHPQKPDEWLVLCCLLPWWLFAVRDVRAPGVRAWPIWAHALVLGGLLLTHTFYFLPLGVATVLGMALDAVRRGPQRLPLGRAAAIAVLGLLLSAPSWSPQVLARLRGEPVDDLQLRYAFPGGNVPHLPDLTEPVGLLELAGLVWLVVAAWRGWRRGAGDPLSGGLAVALAGAWLTLGLGAVAERYDVGLLTFKTNDLVESVLAVAGVVAGGRLLARLLARLGDGSANRGVPAVLPAVLTGALLAVPVHIYLQHWVVGRPALVAQTTAYPDGTTPAGARGLEPVQQPASVRAGDPSVAELLEAWDGLSGAAPRSETVLVTARVDLLATTPVHGFLAWKSIYSNPLGQFHDRLDLLEQVADCPDADCAAAALRGNRFDAVDGLILERDGATLNLDLKLDDFPDRTRPVSVRFPGDLFAAPAFERRDVGRWSVIALRD